MTKLLIGITLAAFAANSVLCRLALSDEAIDPYSFTTLRILSGVAMLFFVAAIYPQKAQTESLETGSWKSAAALYAYAISFSLAYLSLGSGTGALILFGVVQVMMLLVGFYRGERLNAGQWFGFVAALVGLVYLLSPGFSAPDLIGSLLMVTSGVAWAFYTIAGKGSASPVAMTKGNFLKAAPFAIGVSVIAISKIDAQPRGMIIAAVSGAFTSGLAYSLWYMVLPKLSTTRAAILQLLVPLLAALGGVLFLNEIFTIRIAIAGALILGGVVVSTKKVNSNAAS